MFKIKNVYCEDKKLADVLRALAGLLIEAPVPVPVLAAKAQNGKVISTLPGGGSNISARSQFMHYVTEQGYDSINAEMARKFLKSIGQSVSGSGNLINKLKEEGFLAKPKGMKGKPGDWLVNADAIRGDK